MARRARAMAFVGALVIAAATGDLLRPREDPEPAGPTYATMEIPPLRLAPYAPPARRVPRIRGTVWATDGNPVEGAWVRVAAAGTRARNSPFDVKDGSVQTDADGTYTIEAARGVHSVLAFKVGYNAAASAPVRVEGPGEVAAGDIVLERVGVAVLNVTVRRADGSAYQGSVQIVARGVDDDAIGYVDVTCTAAAIATPAPRITAGRYTLRATLRDERAVSRPVQLRAIDGVTHDVDFRPEKLRSLRILVLDPGGAPVSGASVKLRTPDRRIRTAATRHDGWAGFGDILEHGVGPRELAVWHAGFGGFRLPDGRKARGASEWLTIDVDDELIRSGLRVHLLPTE
jgi:hypothetical protein